MRQLLPALAILFLMPLSLKAQTEPLTGRIIGSTYSVDYTTGNPSTTVNTKESVFDDNLNTFFASYDRSYTWVGLDLGRKTRNNQNCLRAKEWQCGANAAWRV